MVKSFGFVGLAVATALGFAASAANANTLVVSGDEWQLSNYAYDAPYMTGTQGFVASLAATFGGTNYLLLSGNSNVPASQLSLAAAQLTSLGKTVTLSSTFVTGYDAVFHFGQAINIAALDAYVSGGGNAYVSLGSGYYGSAAGEAAAWNPFLASYGLVAGSEWFSLPMFVQATVTSGPPNTPSLIWGYGQSVEKLSPASTSVSYIRGSFVGGPTDIGLVGASQRLIPGGGVPEPATWTMMIIGFGAAGSMIRRRKAVIA